MYQTVDGKTAIEVMLSNDTVWLTIDKMAELFQRNKSTISRHIKNILECGELAADSVVAFFATTIGMTILKKIVLSKRYGKAIYAISAVLTLAISSLVFFNPYAIPMAILLKLVSIPIILYLYTTFTKKTEIYFYLKLGISRKEYYYIPFVVEFVGFLIFITLIGYLGNAIR